MDKFPDSKRLRLAIGKEMKWVFIKAQWISITFQWICFPIQDKIGVHQSPMDSIEISNFNGYPFEINGFASQTNGFPIEVNRLPRL